MKCNILDSYSIVHRDNDDNNNDNNYHSGISVTIGKQVLLHNRITNLSIRAPNLRRGPWPAISHNIKN